MAAGDETIQKIDAFVADLFTNWNVWTILFATLLFVFLVFPWLTWEDPDTHPFLLARQAGASPIRQKGQSSVYRAVEIPYGYPLRAGLGVRDPGAPKWSSGRNGDLRDIWRQAVKGPVKDDGTSAGSKGKILTLLGREKIVEHSLDDLTRDINAIGKYVQECGVKTAAICLPNSVEFLSSLFAAAFYGFRPVLIPYGISPDGFNTILSKVSADLLIVQAGTVDLKLALSAVPGLKQVIWVAQSGSQHMDWSEVPEGTGSAINVSVWQDLIDEKVSSTSSEVLPFDKETKVSHVVTIWPSRDGSYELIEYTSENLIAGVAGLNAVLPRAQRFSSDDLVMPVSSLTLPYSLCVTFAALFSHASIALNSVAGDTVDVTLVAACLSPTVIVSSSKTAVDYHEKTVALQAGMVARLSKAYQKRSLNAGIMPSASSTVSSGTSLSKLRLLMVAHRAGDVKSPKLSSSVLSDLRLSLGARIAYALTGAGVAGAICQTNVLDYREKIGDNHFGAPLSCVEVHLTGEEASMAKSEPQGKLVVAGPAVSGGVTKLDVEAQIDEDNTLVLI